MLHKYCFQFLLAAFELPRETEDNAYAKFRGHKQRALWYVMVFSGVQFDVCEGLVPVQCRCCSCYTG